MSIPLRYVPNSSPDYHAFVSQHKTGTQQDTPTFKRSTEHTKLQRDIRLWIEQNVQLVTKLYPTNSPLTPTSVKGHNKRDFSIYVGTGGNAYLHWRLSNFYEMEGDKEKAKDHQLKAVEAVNVALSLLPRMRPGEGIAFYIGNAGIHALASIIHWDTGDQTKSREHLDNLLSCLGAALHSSAADEMLYGRAGYLFSLKFVSRHVGKEVIGEVPLESTMRRVFDAIVESGKKNSGIREPNTGSLQYNFYGTDYHGAAHGTSGILYILLQFPQWCREPAIEPWIKNTLDSLVSLQLLSGNFPPNARDNSDWLVHWCHGAPGIVYTLYYGHMVFVDEKFKKSLESSLNVIWERGVLKKGNGLCHGTSGSGYAFLMMYRHTGSEEHLYRAFKMAEFCLSEEVKQEVAAFRDPQRKCQGVADFPLSLMEGLGGTICFHCDLLHPDSAAFPGYDGDI